MRVKLEYPVTTRNASNVRVWKSLFADLLRQEEYNGSKGAYTVFTLKDREDTVYFGKTFYSLYKIYMESTYTDPTEYDFAMKVFGSWDYWEELTTRSYVKQLVFEWREEKNKRAKSIVVKAMMEQIMSGKASFSAFKYLADGGYLPMEVNSVGRPKKEVKQEDPTFFPEDKKRFDSILLDYKKPN